MGNKAGAIKDRLDGSFISYEHSERTSGSISLCSPRFYCFGGQRGEEIKTILLLTGPGTIPGRDGRQAVIYMLTRPKTHPWRGWRP